MAPTRFVLIAFRPYRARPRRGAARFLDGVTPLIQHCDSASGTGLIITPSCNSTPGGPRHGCSILYHSAMQPRPRWWGPAYGLIENCPCILCCSSFFSCFEDRRKKKAKGIQHSLVDMADKGRRQQPGYACEECRRRKARCDRARPTCGLCLESSTVCLVLDRKPQRGPKKGRINAMRSQIGLWHPSTHLHLHTLQVPYTPAQPPSRLYPTLTTPPHIHEYESMRHS